MDRSWLSFSTRSQSSEFLSRLCNSTNLKSSLILRCNAHSSRRTPVSKVRFRRNQQQRPRSRSSRFRVFPSTNPIRFHKPCKDHNLIRAAHPRGDDPIHKRSLNHELRNQQTEGSTGATLPGGAEERNLAGVGKLAMARRQRSS